MQNNKYKSFHNYLRYAVVLPWILLSFIAINHLFVNQYWTKFYFSKYFFGILLDAKFFGIFCWFTFIITLIYLGRKFLLKAIIIFSIFFVFGYIKGPYLEPPSDPFEHLRRTHDKCDRKVYNFPKKNRGLLHYSMSGNFLCKKNHKENQIQAEEKLERIDLLHGLFLGMISVSLFILAKNAGLPNRWSFLSIMITFLFMGTNRFSYISYYSLAPSFTSMLIYWLWTASFFFKNKPKEILSGLIIGVLTIPIIMVNHLQEAFFIIFILSIWILYNCSLKIRSILSKRKIFLNLYYILIFSFLFFLPQFIFFQKIFQKFFLRNYLSANNNFILYWNNWHLGSKIWSAHRVADTFGLIAILPIIIIPIILLIRRYFNTTNIKKHRNNKIIILGILPLIGYYIPLFHFAWISNVQSVVYYRLVYTSLYSLLFSYFFYLLEYPLIRKYENIINKSASRMNIIYAKRKIIYFSGVVLIFLGLSSIRSGPIYGKLDFLLLDNKPWWPEWKTMIKEIVSNNSKKMIFADPITSTILKGIFNKSTIYFRETTRNKRINIDTILNLSNTNKYNCLINLKGFTPSWVPKDTGHWQWDLSYTNFYYGIGFNEREKIKEKLKKSKDHFQNCNIFY